MPNLWCSKVKLTIPWSSGIYPCIIFTGLWSLVDLVELHPITLILQVVQEYERAVIFRLGRVVGGAKGPGKENLIYSLQCTYYTVMQLYFVTWGLCVFAPCIDCLHHFLMLMFLLVVDFFLFKDCFFCGHVLMKCKKLTSEFCLMMFHHRRLVFWSTANMEMFKFRPWHCLVCSSWLCMMAVL